MSSHHGPNGCGTKYYPKSDSGGEKKEIAPKGYSFFFLENKYEPKK
jgi:hypothetical protein